MLTFGMPTLIEAPSAQESAALCRELGLRFVELNMNLPHYQLDAVDAAQLCRIAEEHGIFYTIHLDENTNVCDFNPYVAQAYLRTVRESIALAGEIGAPVVNMHMPYGVYFTLPDRRAYLFEEYRALYLARMADFRAMCEDAAAGAGVKVCIENTEGFAGFQKESLEMLLHSPVFALTYDVGHDHGCGGLDAAYIRQNAAHLTHMHLHDARGRKNHLPLGTGEIDLNACLRLADAHDCRVVLETKTVDGLRQSVRWLERSR